MNSKTVIKRMEIPYEEITTASMTGRYFFIKKRLFEKGFDLDKKINRCENLDEKTIVYTQEKYVVPKVKRYEET